MAYKELVKNFNRIRDYMREFYVYGFKSRDEYTNKSARSYDDEKRRIESYLADYMGFRQTSEAKNVFISLDSRKVSHNPLYKVWKTKSFTDGDITLHFILFDILANDISLNIKEIMDEIDDYLSIFDNPKMFDESNVRKKLKEYIEEGLIISEKKGKTLYYRRNSDCYLPNIDILDYFSEVMPCGIIGSYLLDKYDDHDSHFTFKHHYITSTMDANILYDLFVAINKKCSITIESISRFKAMTFESEVVPLKIMISVQNGRQYLMGFSYKYKRITAFRIDNIVKVKINDRCEEYEMLQDRLSNMLKHMWGVSTKSYYGNKMEHVDFTVCYGDHEQYIRRRLEREKRCGTLEYIDNNTIKFSADVYDVSEMIPWIRSFICRIIDINFSNEILAKQFNDDLNEMYKLYDI